MKPGRIAALVIGCVLLVPGMSLFVLGGMTTIVYGFGQGSDDYLDVTLRPVATETVAIFAEQPDFAADPGDTDWLLDFLDLDIRLRALSADGGEIFVGIGPEADVVRYLSDAPRDQITEVDGRTPMMDSVDGDIDSELDPPADEDFWVASASGPGVQEIEWEATGGRWTVVLMNADASAGVAASVNVGVKSDVVIPLALGILGVGLVLAVGGTALVIIGVTGPREDEQDGDAQPAQEPPADDPPAAVS